METQKKSIIGPCIRLHPADNVLVARMNVAIGAQVPGKPGACAARCPPATRSPPA